MINNGIINAFVEGARLSWVDVNDVAQVAALALARPDLHAGKTYRLGDDAVTFVSLRPEELLQSMIDAAAEMAYMSCVYEHTNAMPRGLSLGPMTLSIIS